MRFQALETFDSPETRSTYVKGFSYTIRPGNEILARLAKDWLGRGMIEMHPGSEPPSNVAGQGIVT